MPRRIRIHCASTPPPCDIALATAMGRGIKVVKCRTSRARLVPSTPLHYLRSGSHLHRRPSSLLHQTARRPCDAIAPPTCPLTESSDLCLNMRCYPITPAQPSPVFTRMESSVLKSAKSPTYSYAGVVYTVYNHVQLNIHRVHLLN